MRRLSAHSIFAAARDCIDADSYDSLAWAVVAAVRSIVACDTVSYNRVSLQSAEVTYVDDPPGAAPRARAAALSAHLEDPVVAGWFLEEHAPFRASDFLRGPRRRSLGAFADLLESEGTRDQLVFTLPHANGSVPAIALTRREDFSDGELRSLADLGLYLAAAHEHLAEKLATTATLAELRSALDLRAEDRLAADGAPHGLDTGEDRAGGTARLQRLGLSRRQAEVLDLVAQGASNRQVADALGISLRTVHKHLELLYRRLGVQSRTSAAALVHEEFT